MHSVDAPEGITPRAEWQPAPFPSPTSAGERAKSQETRGGTRVLAGEASEVSATAAAEHGAVRPWPDHDLIAPGWCAPVRKEIAAWERLD